MICFQIDPQNAPDWCLFAEETEGFTYSAAPSIAFVLLQVKRVFEYVWGSDAVNARKQLIVVHGEGDPTAFKRYGIIFLSSTGAYFFQHIFQFAHELCHMMSPYGACPPYKWFEESLCQLMSRFALKQIQVSGILSAFFDSRSLDTLFDDYIAGIRSCPLENQTFCEFLSGKLAYLRENPTDRDINETVALQLYPLFSANPRLWQIVPYLHLIDSDASLKDALLTVGRAANLPCDLVDRLIACFFE